MPALLNKKHRKPQWTSKKFGSKIIGAESQFDKALTSKCIICILSPLFVQWGKDSLVVRCENGLHSACAGVLSLWHAWSQSKPQCSDTGSGLLERRDSVIREGKGDPSICGPVLIKTQIIK